MGSRGKGRPVRGYRDSNDKRVPSVTTVISRFKDSGGLIHWAWKLGLDGKDYKKEMTNAARVGHMVHQWIDDTIHSKPLTDYSKRSADDLERARKGLEAYKTWAKHIHLKVIETEVPMSCAQFGGTPDCLADIDGDPVLLDWKTSNAVYGDYIVQLAAYRDLYRQKGIDVQDAYLLRVGKEYGDFHFHMLGSDILDIAWQYFEHALEMYRLDKELKKVFR